MQCNRHKAASQWVVINVYLDIRKCCAFQNMYPTSITSREIKTQWKARWDDCSMSQWSECLRQQFKKLALSAHWNKGSFRGQWQKHDLPKGADHGETGVQAYNDGLGWSQWGRWESGGLAKAFSPFSQKEGKSEGFKWYTQCQTATQFLGPDCY